jgi:hypothetical protein
MIKSTIMPGVSDRKIKDATKSLTIRVTKKHHKAAVQCDGKHCVLAKAFDDSNVGEFYQGVEVGLTVTKITVAGVIMRYATPPMLRKYIREFDLTGKWHLPEGEYTFKPLCPTMRQGGRPNRWLKHRFNTDGSGRDTMKERAAPTRRISKIAA